MNDPSADDPVEDTAYTDAPAAALTPAVTPARGTVVRGTPDDTDDTPPAEDEAEADDEAADDEAADDEAAAGAEGSGSAVTTAVNVPDPASATASTGSPARHAGTVGVVNTHAGYRTNVTREANPPPNAAAIEE